MMQNSNVFRYSQGIGAKWFRLNAVIWRTIEPTAPVNNQHAYNWASLATVERDILAANRAGLTVVLGVKEHPSWAVVNRSRPCSAVRDDRMWDFAAFMQALVNRLKSPPYNVKYWEMGNEPDVDPVFQSEGYGCWGNISDPYYGGERYGRMLNIVGPTIRSTDPGAKIVLGGLLLNTPNTPLSAGIGKPEKFLEGVLRVPGAANNIDIVAYHVYMWYQNRVADHDLTAEGWQSDYWRGAVRGKTRYLRELMASYGISKPMYINELGLICHPNDSGCNPISQQYYEVTADHVARFLTRGLADSVKMYSWYMLNGPGWLGSSLLDDNQAPRPAYRALQAFAGQTQPSGTPFLVNDYGSAVEAHRFPRSGVVVDVLWSSSATTHQVEVAANRFIAAYARDGQALRVSIVNGQARLNVGFSPVYIWRWAN